MEELLFTSESVSEGHPDKLCDQISDAILDACIKEDPKCHVACETFATKNCIIIAGEISSSGKKLNVDYEAIARNVALSIGYDDEAKGLNGKTCQVDVRINSQSPDIAMGVEKKSILDMGAGDQGIMFGYATEESEGYMPLPIVIAHKLVRTASKMRKEGNFPHARPDMKSQVTIDYTDKSAPRIYTIVMSVQHDEGIDLEEFRKFIHDNIMVPVAKSFGLNDDFIFYINPTGAFVIGGPLGDTGLTGRKIIVDTYGGSARHGGGAFSGKDPSKVDRSACYYARYMAKNLVAAGAASRLEIQLSYAIGKSEPISISVSTFGTKKEGITDEMILDACRLYFDARPGAIIESLGLRSGAFLYQDTATYGAFGRSDHLFPWEKLDKVEELKKFFEERKNRK
ncbi:MAG: methionine adenosyltransferase [Bacilli bacterium]|nr:methionine adenosyltransferase [Bacilli bacterium]